MNLVQGVDVSHWQKPQDWHKLKSQGIEFAFVKATEGSSGQDKMFTSHVQSAKNAGLLVGAYHYFKPRVPPVEQVSHFLSTCAAVDLDLPPALDMETMDGVGALTVCELALIWLAAAGVATKKTPIIYSGLYFINGLHNPHEFAKYPLWLAQYRNRMPTTPHPFEKWTFWQNSGTDLDHNYFNGDLAALKEMTL